MKKKEYRKLLNDIENIINVKLSTLNIPENTTQDEKLLTRKRVLEILQIAPSTLYSLTKSGKLPYIRHGRKMFFKQSDLIKG